MGSLTEVDMQVRPLIIAGPCSLESEQIALDVANRMRKLAHKLNFTYVFKGSFDKANRTSHHSFRGPGLKEGVRILRQVKAKTNVLVTTDIHEPWQAERVAEVVDLIQIPAFLCRQTDLLVAAGETGKPVNVKKGQFAAPEAMRFAVDKVQSVSRNNVFLTERGTFFGYGDLVVDFRGLVEMKTFAPVIFDVSHSVQRPARGGGSSGGDRKYMRPLARSAAALGVYGLFFETHPDPDSALSDNLSTWPLSAASRLIQDFLDAYTSQGTVNR